MGLHIQSPKRSFQSSSSRFKVNKPLLSLSKKTLTLNQNQRKIPLSPPKIEPHESIIIIANPNLPLRQLQHRPEPNPGPPVPAVGLLRGRQQEHHLLLVGRRVQAQVLEGG